MAKPEPYGEPIPAVTLPDLHQRDERGLIPTPRRMTLLRRNEARDFSLNVIRSDAYRESVRARAAKGTLPPAIETMLWHYAYGKPAEQVVIRDERRDLSNLSEEELAERAELIATVLRAVRDINESLPADVLDSARDVTPSGGSGTVQ